MAHYADYEKKVCEYCGEEFFIRGVDMVNTRDYRFCSNKCAEAAKMPDINAAILGSQLPYKTKK